MGAHAPAQVPAHKFSSLTSYARCLLCCLQHYDFHNALCICYWRLSLASAIEFEVQANCLDFRVSSGDAAEILGCLMFVLPADCCDHVDDGNTRWSLVCYPYSLNWMSEKRREQLDLPQRKRRAFLNSSYIIFGIATWQPLSKNAILSDGNAACFETGPATRSSGKHHAWEREMQTVQQT